MRKLILCLLVGLWYEAAGGAEPKAKITGPTRSVCGMAEFSAAESANVKNRKWKCKPTPDSAKEYNGGQVFIVVSTKARDFEISLTVSSDDGGLDDDTITTSFVAEVIPIPVKQSVIQDYEDFVQATQTDTSKQVAKWCKDVKTRGAKDEAETLAAVFRNAHAKIIADEISTPDELLSYTGWESKRLLRLSWGSWNRAVLELLRETLDQLSADGDLATMQSYADIWQDVAKGLESFAAR